VLLAGDHLLPGITPNPGLYADTTPPRSGLPDYFASLSRLLELNVSLVLPGHRTPFIDASARITEMLYHHEQRIDLTRRLAYPATTVLQLAKEMFGAVEGIHRYFALLEAYGHLEALRLRGEAEIIGKDGVDAYRLLERRGEEL
jgi:glyoxylase-like metal-dependent hydrolase (beta-lactamase superfamily II)